MSAVAHDFLGYEELPIPEDACADDSWPESMLEMAAHIGAYRTLQLVDVFGGMRIYIPLDPEKGKSYGRRGSIVDAVGIGAAAKLSAIYGSEYYFVPRGRGPVERAKRAPILVAVREGRLSGNEAAAMLRMQRSHFSKLVNGTDARRMTDAELHRSRRHDPRQIELFGDE